MIELKSDVYNIESPDTLVIDCNESIRPVVKNFNSDCKLKFINTPTKNIKDIKVTNKDFDIGEAVLSCGDADLKLVGLKNGNFYNIKTFIDLYGKDSITVE